MKIAIIGGGASGMLCAVTIKRENPLAEVIVLERLDRVGKKLMATGNGRCNITNEHCTKGHYHGQDASGVEQVFSAFSPADCAAFFSSIGVVFKTEENGKQYPLSDQASSVVDCLRYTLLSLGVVERTGFAVCSVKKERGGFCITSQNGDTVKVDIVVAAGGGMASPALGSNGSLFPVLKSFGHTVTPLFPALVQLRTDKLTVRPLKGIKFTGTAKLLLDKACLQEEAGEVLFTEYGVSGPPILNLARKVGEYFLAHPQGRGLFLSLNLLPGYSYPSLQELLFARAKALPHKTLEQFFSGMLNKRIGQTLFKHCGIVPLTREVNSLSAKELKTLAGTILDWRFPLLGTMPFQNAQVCAGGVPLREINLTTMESKLCRNLFLTGELLDIDGDCGGYNLQWAWATGYLAGKEAAKRS